MPLLVAILALAVIAGGLALVGNYSASLIALGAAVLLPAVAVAGILALAVILALFGDDDEGPEGEARWLARNDGER